MKNRRYFTGSYSLSRFMYFFVNHFLIGKLERRARVWIANLFPYFSD